MAAFPYPIFNLLLSFPSLPLSDRRGEREGKKGGREREREGGRRGEEFESDLEHEDGVKVVGLDVPPLPEGGGQVFEIIRWYLQKRHVVTEHNHT